MKTKLDDLVSLLDGTLRCSAFQDVSNNGLQIANAGTVSRVVTGVDASLRLLREAARRGADCVVCHHGLSWGDSLKRLTGLNHRLVAFAVEHNIAVYAAHLPLDAHPRFGNNAQLCKALGLSRLSPAFCYHGEVIGFSGTYAKPVTLAAFCECVRKAVNPDLRILDFGKKSIRRVGVVSGGAADMVDQAAALGCDVYLTGEPSLQGYNLAENLAQNVVVAGHYATEIFGVRSLAALITRRLGLAAECLDFKIGY
jgi:dinuclear metal center YbgI/SA1388 family protein